MSNRRDQSKRRREHDRRQTQQAGAAEPAPNLRVAWYSLPKISETLVAFAGPLFDLLPADAGEEHYHHALGLAAAVWNDSLLGGGRQELVERELGALAASAGLLPGILAAVVEKLRARKRRMYKADQRYIVDFLSWGAGNEIRVRAEAIDFAATERLMQSARDLGMDEEEAFTTVMETVRSQRKPL